MVQSVCVPATAQARSPLSAADQRVVRAKRTMATLFLVAMAPLIYLFVRHKLYVIPGGTQRQLTRRTGAHGRETRTD